MQAYCTRTFLVPMRCTALQAKPASYLPLPGRWCRVETRTNLTPWPQPTTRLAPPLCVSPPCLGAATALVIFFLEERKKKDYPLGAIGDGKCPGQHLACCEKGR